MNILNYIYQDNNLTFYIVLAIISFSFIVLISLSMTKKNKKEITKEEDVIELPKVKEKIETLDSDTFIKRLEDLKKK